MTDRVIEKIALPIIVLAGVLIFMIVFSAQNTNKENNAYIRVINCIISKNANTRKQADIEDCYKTVEAESGIKIDRYDNSSKE